MNILSLKTLCAIMVLAVCCPLFAAEPVRHGDPYPFATDPVTGAPLGEKPIIHLTDNGRELRFTNNEALEQFKKEPKPVLEKLDKQIVDQQLKTYALDKCPIGGEALGSMGETVDFVYNNRLVRLCCSGCTKSVAKKPDATLAKLDAAVIAKQSAAYPLKTCVVRGEDLPEKPVDVVVGSRLFRLCCGECAEAVKKDPAKYLAKLDAAGK